MSPGARVPVGLPGPGLRHGGRAGSAHGIPWVAWVVGSVFGSLGLVDLFLWLTGLVDSPTWVDLFLLIGSLGKDGQIHGMKLSQIYAPVMFSVG